MTENEKPENKEQSNIIDPKDYTEDVQTEGEAVKQDEPQVTETTAPTKYQDHVITKAVNRITPTIINKLILDCEKCEQLTEDEISETGLGEACAWFIDEKFPTIPTNTPTVALISSCFALTGLVAFKHPFLKSRLEAVKQAGQEA